MRGWILQSMSPRGNSQKMTQNNLLRAPFNQ